MTNDIRNLVRKNIIKLKPYTSARSLVTDAEIFLDANESPFEPSGTSICSINRYPEPQPSEIVSLLADIYGVNTENLIIGRGSDEIIDCLFRVFCEPGKDRVLISPPTYGVYAVQAEINDCGIIEVPLTREPEFKIDFEGILSAVDENCKLIFVCSPNNPVGSSADLDVVDKLCKNSLGKCIVVIDEAYIEFSKRESFIKRLSKFKNAVVLRTMSKAWGMAGARLGSAVADPEIISYLKKVIAPYPISAPTVKAVSDVLNDPEIMEKQTSRIEKIVKERESLKAELEKISCVEAVFESDANFLLLKTDSPDTIVEKCRKSGIIVRNRNSVVPGAIRISVGTTAENAKLLQTLRSGD